MRAHATYFKAFSVCLLFIRCAFCEGPENALAVSLPDMDLSRSRMGDIYDYAIKKYKISASKIEKARKVEDVYRNTLRAEKLIVDAENRAQAMAFMEEYRKMVDIPKGILENSPEWTTLMKEFNPTEETAKAYAEKFREWSKLNSGWWKIWWGKDKQWRKIRLQKELELIERKMDQQDTRLLRRTVGMQTRFGGWDSEKQAFSDEEQLFMNLANAKTGDETRKALQELGGLDQARKYMHDIDTAEFRNTWEKMWKIRNMRDKTAFQRFWSWLVDKIYNILGEDSEQVSNKLINTQLKRLAKYRELKATKALPAKYESFQGLGKDVGGDYKALTPYTLTYLCDDNLDRIRKQAGDYLGEDNARLFEFIHNRHIRDPVRLADMLTLSFYGEVPAKNPYLERGVKNKYLSDLREMVHDLPMPMSTAKHLNGINMNRPHPRSY